MTTKSDNKYKECLLILQNMHEMLTVIIETGNDKGLSALDILDDCLRVERLNDDVKQVQAMTINEINHEGYLN